MTPLRLSRACAVAALACVVAFNPVLAQRTYRPGPIAVQRTGPKHLLYRVTGAHGATVYLLGSVHLLTAEAGRLPPEVDTAFAHAKTIAFETSLDTVMLRAPELLARGRYANGATLRSSLSPAGIAALDTVLPAYGLTVDQMNGFKPWFVSMVLSQLVMQRSNFQAQYGVEIQLNARAHDAGKTIIGLEPVDVQLGLFDSISPADQERMLLDGGMPDSASRELLRIKDAWLAGDAERIDSIMNRRTPGSANLVATLVTRRTLSWMPAILGLLAGKDDALVVVGAGHIVGSQGIVALLRAKGYAVEQL
ncbi:MAG TPA: TraB/GumN family protein [Gemmatimonadaceae bacterium]